MTRLARCDDDVYRLCIAGYVGAEIRELLDLSEEALRASLDRLASWLAPTAASQRSIDLSDCLPFDDAFLAGTQRSRRDMSRSGEAGGRDLTGGGDIVR